MPKSREKKSLSMTEYDIAGNAIRAYYDASNNLVFVLDEMIDADKPNVLLVIDSFDERKWDEVLVNDYNVNLETVRPKRDNKYQKLDIEYGGLDVYSELIDAYESGDDLTDALDNLARFRAMSVHRATQERLDAAETTIEKSRETIERTNDAISELRARVKELRARITDARRGIGREPTKASAAKILKAEAQLDSVNDKLARAKKRLTSAQHRLANAEDDAEIARAILARNANVDKPKKRAASASHRPQPVITMPEKSVVDAEYDIDYEEDILPEPSVSEMPEINDNEVKPLFDKDPENLDDEIAFKPIDFGSGESVSDNVSDSVPPAPLSFAPPVQNVSEEYTAITDETPDTPMLEGMEPLPKIELSSDSDMNTQLDTIPEFEPVQPETENIETTPIPDEVQPMSVAPITSVAPSRPVSPIAPGAVGAKPVEPRAQKSTFMYYLMLVLLILLSIGTLWLYQKSAGDSVPDLSKPVPETTVATSETKPADSAASGKTPFVAMPNIAKEKTVETAAVANIPEPVATPVVEQKPVETVVAEPEPSVEPVVVEPEPVAVVAETTTVAESVAPVVEPEPVAVQAEAVVVEEIPEVVEKSPFVDLEPALRTVATYEPEPVKIPSEEEVIASKPGYNVSQNENMFVASDDYDTETVVEPIDDDYADAPESVCEGGAPTDEMGCCPGENYTYTDDGFMCCNTVECFPPAE